MDYEVAFRLEKKIISMISMWNFEKFRKYYSKFVWFPGKNIIDIQSFSSQLYEIIIDYFFKVI